MNPHLAVFLRITKVMVCAFLLAFALVLAPIARGDTTIFDNLNTPTPNSYFDIEATNFWYGQSFTVGNFTGQLSHVMLNMNTPVDTSGNFFVRLYADSSTLPGSLLETLVGTSNPATSGIFDFTGSSPLSANTTYWVVAGVSSGSGDYRWNLELPASIESGSTIGWTYSNDQGVTWQGLNGPGQPPPFSPLLTMSVRVTAVPEPSSLALAAIATGLVVGGYRFRKRPTLTEG